MKNLLSYESINEAEAALPAMPAFLKAVKAVEQFTFASGMSPKNKAPNSWVVEATSPIKKETWSLYFYPDGTFFTMAGSSLTNSGKWKADSASNFKFGTLSIKGVKMEFTEFMVSNPPA